MRYRLECPANRYVFKSSESTAGSLRQSGSEFQTVGPATEKARVPKVPRRTRGINSNDVWQITDDGDQELQRLARNIRRGNLELSAEDNDGLSQRACTALAGE